MATIPPLPPNRTPSNLFMVLLTGILMEVMELQGKHPRLDSIVKALLIIPMVLTLAILLIAKRF